MTKSTFAVLAALALANICSLAQKRTPAFPGAEGYGMYVTGGRGGKVYHVTTLEDTESMGSLRHAIKQSGARTIVFDVSGTIFLKSPLKITNGDLTIAGQTAPGDGICVADWPVSLSAKNVIVRYVRFRCGNRNVSQTEGDGGHEGDGFGGTDGANIIVDHCSVSWSVDECLSVYGNRNTTVQWCIASNSLRNAGHHKGAHGYGAMMGGGKTTYHHNLIAHHDSRTPRFVFRTGDETSPKTPTDFRNNVIYNYGKNGAYGGEEMNINLVNNYYKPGPFTLMQPEGYQKRIIGIGVGTHKDQEGNVKEYVWGHYYLNGNVNSRWKDVTEDNWNIGLVQQVSDSNYGWNATTQDTIHSSSPMPFAYVTTHSAEKAFEKVVKYAGASYRRDEYDRIITGDTEEGDATFTGKNETDRPGIIDSADEITYADGHTGWPTLKQGQVQTDTDGDGMPDEWETANGLNPEDSADGNLINEEGYTNLEVYMNSIVKEITEAQTAEGDKLGEDVASTGELYPPTIDDPCTIMIPTNEDLDLNKLKKNQNGKLANGGELKEVDGDMTIDNARNGDYVTFTLYNSIRQAYNLDFMACTNRGGDEVITIHGKICDDKEATLTEQVVTIAKSGWTDFKPYTMEMGTLPEGMLSLTLTFANANGKYTANTKRFKLTPSSTGIGYLQRPTTGEEKSYYDMAGRRVKSDYRGVVIQQDKKQIPQ